MRAMSRRIFLHVGSPKTGTTFLQQVLWSQRQLAQSQGLLLPGSAFSDHYLASLDVRGLADRPQHPRRAVGMWQQMAAESASWAGDVLISHELFAGATEQQCKQALDALGDEAEVHIVVTARDLARQIPAEWQEHLKHRSTKPFATFVADIREDSDGSSWFWRVQDYAGVISRWGCSLPMAQVHVVTVPQSGADPTTLWRRFSTLVGLDPSTFSLTGFPINPSLHVEQAEILRRVNTALGDRLPYPGPYPAVVKSVFAHRVLASREGKVLALRGEDRDFAVARSRELVVALAGSGCEVVGDLQELMPPEPATAEGEPVGAAPPSDEALLAESVAALAGLLDAYWSELSTLRSDRRELRQGLQAAEHRLAEATAERDRLLHDMRHRPLRHLLIGLSTRWSWLMAMRRAYRRVRTGTPPAPEGGPGDDGSARDKMQA